MKKLFMLVLSAVLLCSSLAYAQEELRLYVWSEAVPTKAIEMFEQETGIILRIDNYESNEEMVAKLQAGGVGQYDLVMPSDFIIPSMIELGLLQQIDHSKLTGMENLTKSLLNPAFDPGNKYTLPYWWGTLGLLYNKEIVKEPTGSMGLILDPANNPGTFLFIDSPREMMGMALKYMGESVNTTNPETLKKMAQIMIDAKQRDNCAGFQGGVGGKNKVAGGSVATAVVYNGDAALVVADNPEKFGFFVPKEGAPLWMDNYAMVDKAPNVESAYKWLSFNMRPEIAAMVANDFGFANGNEASKKFIKKEILNDPAIYVDEATMKNLELIIDQGKNNRYYDEVWTMIKSR